VKELRRRWFAAIAQATGKQWSFSGEKARRELGWQPRSLEQGMAELRDWFAAA
jgi:nucleoside-diphosphate-sugar epimerase